MFHSQAAEWLLFFIDYPQYIIKLRKRIPLKGT